MESEGTFGNGLMDAWALDEFVVIVIVIVVVVVVVALGVPEIVDETAEKMLSGSADHDACGFGDLIGLGLVVVEDDATEMGPRPSGASEGAEGVIGGFGALPLATVPEVEGLEGELGTFFVGRVLVPDWTLIGGAVWIDVPLSTLVVSPHRRASIPLQRNTSTLIHSFLI